MNDQQHPEGPDAASRGAELFPVVGIGASAGGLPALMRLLEHMPPAPDMALVVVLHLAPDLPSSADRILQRATDMPVLQVTTRVPLRPNQVYVISPGLGLQLEDGDLVADRPQSLPGVPMTINIFLRTLAEGLGERAIGVLLSGMGTDGVAGLGAVKAHGGIAIAQLPADAEEGGLPQAAIDAGVVDFVLPAAQIPDRLIEMRELMETIRRVDAGIHAEQGGRATSPDAGLDAVLALLYAGTGYDFHDYKPDVVLRRIERRMQVRGAVGMQAYRALLESDAREADSLVQDLLAGASNFFHGRGAFTVLEKTVLPRIFHGRAPGEPLRAWVVGCSTGEEAYSLGMLLAEHAECIGGAPAMQLFATDLDEQALAVARAGRYPDTIAADIPADRLARYFMREDDMFRVRRLLRDRILFARHDLLHDPAFSRLDLITCDNALVSLNAEAQRVLLEIFYCALKPGGYLFLCGADSAAMAPDLFAPVNGRYRLYQARLDAKATRRMPLMRAHKARQEADRIEVDVPQEARRSASFAELHQRAQAQLSPPSVLVDAKGDIVHATEGAGAFLRYGGGEPSTQVLALVLPALHAELRTAMFEARQSGTPAFAGPVPVGPDGAQRAVRLLVAPVLDERGESSLTLVQFDAIDKSSVADEADADPSAVRVRELEAALQQARRSLADTAERAAAAEAAHERASARLQATVDALRGEIEELETDCEEHQSRNEELYTVNTELRMRVDETSQANDDLSNLIASTDIATLFLDPRMCIQRYTPAVARLFSVIPADVGRPLAHLTSRLDTRRLLDEVAAVLASGEPVEREARSSDGRDYIVRVHPYRTAYERVEGAVLTFVDISRRRQAETALRESEQRLALAFEALPLGLGIVDANGRTTLSNGVMRRFLPNGLMPSRDTERLGRWRGWDAAGQPLAPADFPGARALRGESVLSGVQMLYQDDEGVETWTEVRSAPLRDGAGTVTGALLVMIDVDRLKRSEEVARAGEERHAFLLELGDALRAQPDEQSIKSTAVAMLAERLGLDRCWIAEVDEDQGCSTVKAEHAAPGLAPMTGLYRLADYPEANRQLLTQAVRIDDVAADERFVEAERGLLEGAGLRALLVAPLRQGQAPAFWTLVAAMDAPRAWRDGEQLLLEEAAERTWAAAERARAERRAENILERMSEAHCVLGHDYRILAVNAAAERLLGRPRPALLGRSHWDAFPKSVDAPVGQAFRRVVEEGIEQHFTHHYTGEGYDFHLEVDAYPTDEGGVAMFWRDVSDRVLAAQALRTSEEKYRALFNGMDEAYAVVEMMTDDAGIWNDFLFLEVNPVFMRHSGMPYPVGRTATQLLGTPNPRWAALYGQAVESGQPIRVEEGELTLGRVFDLNIFRLGDEGSRKVAVLFTDISARKRAEADLQESERRYRLLFENMGEGFALAELIRDADGRVVDWRYLEVNAGWSQTGVAPGDTVGRTAYEVNPAMEPYWLDTYSRVVESGEPAYFEGWAEGFGKWFDTLAFRHSENRFGLLFRDVTERRAAEAARRASESRYRALFESIDEGFLVAELIRDEAGRSVDAVYLEANPAASRLTGVADFIDRRLSELTLGGEQKWLPIYDRVVSTGVPERVERYASLNGHWYDFHVSLAVDAGAEEVVGRGPRIAVVFQQITARKQAEAALRESEARFRALAEASPALIWQTDAAGALDYVNGRCLEVTGASVEQLRSGWQDFLHPEDAPAYLDALAQALAAQGAFQQRVRVRMGDGRHRWFDSYALPWHAIDGRFLGLVGMLIDVEDAVEAEEALRTADRRKDEFLATLAHELRNPLAPISNALH